MKHYIFADESNTDKSRFLLIGGIWVDEITYKQVIAECKNFKHDNNWNEKTKFNWKYISKKTLDQYCMYIDIFFKYNLQFNCIIIDRKEINLKDNKDNDAELGFYKFYYELLRRNSKIDVPYYIYLDRRNNKEKCRPMVLKTLLKKDMHPLVMQGKRSFDKGRDVRVLELVNSDSYELIQFADLLLGAIGYHYNKKHLIPEASQHKSAFAMHIAEKIRRKDLIFSTDKNGYKNLNLWLFKQVQKTAKK